MMTENLPLHNLSGGIHDFCTGGNRMMYLPFFIHDQPWVYVPALPHNTSLHDYLEVVYFIDSPHASFSQVQV